MEPTANVDHLIQLRSQVDLNENDQRSDQADHLKDQPLSLPKSGSLPNSEPLAYQNNSLPKSDSLPVDSSLLVSGSLLSMSSLLKDSRLPPNSSQPEITLWDGLEQVKGYIKIPNLYLDKLTRLLDPTEQAVYLQLFRLSWGYGKDVCNIGLPKLAERSNVGKSTAQAVIKRLIDKKLVEKIDWNIGKGKDQGTIYRLPLPVSLSEIGSLPVNSSLVKNGSLPDSNTIKDHDDDYIKKDHHQNNQTEHEKAVMMIYQKITGNSWTKADSDNYTKIKGIPIDKIEVAIRLASQRAINRPNSLAYFVKEILASINPPQQNRTQRKKALEKIIDRISHSYIGSSRSISDFSYDVKEACIREDVPFDLDVFNDIMAKRKS